MAAESREQTAGSRAGDRERVRDRISRRQKAAQSAYAEENRVREQESARNFVPQGAVGTGAKARTLSASAANGGSFYVYSYDGRLLAEYNGYDHCVKDYIYIGNQLLAEYKPQEDEMYFYTPDQINSTRIVTDESGTVVYSAAHDPYGGIQKTWVNTYDPTPKFSGKERDAESGLDYFGARYYDRSQYRFISVDPLIKRYTIDPQRMNLYCFCKNNPINIIDPNGKDLVPIYPPLAVAPANFVHQYIESSFLADVQKLIRLCADEGITLLFCDAYRTPDEHLNLQASNPNAATGWSRHCEGRAIDVFWGNLSAAQRLIVINLATTRCNMSSLNNPNDTNHFQMGPNGTDNGAARAYIAYCLHEAWNELNNAEDLDSMLIYSYFGVFTIDAANIVYCNALNDLYNPQDR